MTPRKPHQSPACACDGCLAALEQLAYCPACMRPRGEHASGCLLVRAMRKRRLTQQGAA